MVQPEAQAQAAPTRPPPDTAEARPGPSAGIAEPGPAAAAPSAAAGEAEEAVESHPLAGGSPPQERTAPPVEGRAGREGEGSGSTLRQRRLHRFQPPTPGPPGGEGAEGA